MFIVTTPANDLSLLSQTELRTAIGLASTDATKDAALAIIGPRVSATIAAACRIARDGINPPTLLSETITETWRIGRNVENLFMSRRLVTSVTSVTVDGTALETTEFECLLVEGLLKRLSSNQYTCWASGVVVAVYVAGLDDIPEEIKLAASLLTNDFYRSGLRDTNLKRVKIEGVAEREYWVSPKDDPLLSGEVKALLSDFMRKANS